MNEAEAVPINASGESAPGAIPEPSAATLEIGRAAFDQHVAEGTKQRGRGRPPIHGKYVGKSKPRPVPVGKVGNGSVPILLEPENPASAVPIGTEEIQPAFDDEVNREYAAIFIEFIVTLKNAKTRKTIFQKTGSQEFTDTVMAKREIGEKPRKAMESGLVGCARKYNVDLSKSPEGMVIGGFLVYLAQDSLNTRAAIAEYFKLRPEEKRA